MTESAKDRPAKTAAPKTTTKKRGRPASEETLKYRWYREVEGFERCDLKQWWSGIDWADQIKAKNAKRSIQHRELMPHKIHAGFLWETLRRLPDFPTLLEELRRLDAEELLGKTLPLVEGLDILGEAQKAHVCFLEEYGVLVVSALRILSKDWKLCFESLPQESRDKWEGCYSELWNAVGEPDSVPSVPPELPAKDPLGYWGQGRTAFDLLIKRSLKNGPTIYEDLPLPSMFLRSFAKLLPSKGADEDLLHPHSSFAQGKTDPCTYPWLSFGILEQHLARYHLHPLALAVDLSKSTDMIVRDLKKIIEQKRNLLGISVADRRIKKESFDKIEELDRGVFGSSDTPLLARTVKEFKRSARLDLSNLISRIRYHMDCGKPGTPQNTQTTGKELKKLLDELTRHPR